MIVRTACDVASLGLRDAVTELARCVSSLETAAAVSAWTVWIPLGVAILALGGVWWTVRQRHFEARSDQMWKRMSWAIDSALSSDDDVKMAGLLAMERLLDENELKKAGFKMTALDVKLLEDVSQTALPRSNGGE